MNRILRNLLLFFLLIKNGIFKIGGWLYSLWPKIKLLYTNFCREIDINTNQLKWAKDKCGYVFFVLIIISYFIYNHYAYGNFPIFKNDIRIEKIIKTKFPLDYDVIIKKGDLVGFGENFYIAYGNKGYIKKLFGGDWNNLENLRKYENEVNYPQFKIFYVEESGLLQYLPDFLLELRVKELYSYKPIIVNNDIKLNISNKLEFLQNEYKKDFSGIRAFFLLDLKILDIDNDGKDEIIPTFISYAGGSGGTKFSIVIEYIDGKIKLSSGYPDFIDYDFSTIYYAILKNLGMIPGGVYNPMELRKKLHIFGSDYLNQDINQFHLFEQKEDFKEDILKLNELYFAEYPSNSAVFFNISNEDNIEENNISYRHTDIYSNYIKYDDKFVFVESFYLNDEKCHWCEHEWMLLSYIYKDGRWLSDRNVNGNGLNAQFLSSDKKYTLHDIHGTFEIPYNVMGLAWSFINLDWNPPALHNMSDPQGIGMIKKSPIIDYMDKIYK